ncbi:MAG: trypsin-like serine protease [bacterium]|nr:trypsin-like serine protease [bacterium]
MRVRTHKAILCAAFAGALLVSAGTARPRSPQPQIVNGTETQTFETTAALLEGSDPFSAQTVCSATLIGCDEVLTAAHCVCDGLGSTCQGASAPDPSNYTVFLQHAGLFAVDSVTVHPDLYFPDDDVAVLKLSTAVTGIRPTPINTIQTPPLGASGTIAGFGRTGGGIGRRNQESRQRDDCFVYAGRVEHKIRLLELRSSHRAARERLQYMHRRLWRAAVRRLRRRCGPGRSDLGGPRGGLPGERPVLRHERLQLRILDPEQHWNDRTDELRGSASGR